MRHVAIAIFLAVTSVLPVAAQEWALGGYDPVSYATAGRPTPGRSDIATMWHGKLWHFATDANRARFEADPRSFAPRFGGMCPLSIVEGRPQPGDPRHFMIHEGSLYLFRSADAARTVRQRPEEILGQAATIRKRD